MMMCLGRFVNEKRENGERMRVGVKRGVEEMVELNDIQLEQYQH